MALTDNQAVVKIADLTRLKESYEKSIPKLEKELIELTRQANAILISADGDKEDAAYKLISADVDKLQVKLQATKDNLGIVLGQLDLIKSDLNPVSETTSDARLDPGVGDVAWEYNPPLAKVSTFSPSGVQLQLIEGELQKYPDEVTDALSYWTDGKLGKGVIQQSRHYPYKFDTLLSNQKPVSSGVLSGFRFLYNPTEIFMNWGVTTEIDVAKFVSGTLLAKPITDAAAASSVSFSIILNRIPDMSILDSAGNLLVEKPYTTPDGNLPKKHGKGIYAKGTMYDLEYLFKTVNGLDSTMISGLGIKSADVGWMNSFPVELHLGNQMRYLVRVTNLEVNHKIFDERMVPVFTVVNIVCKRLPDFGGRLSDAEVMGLKPSGRGITKYSPLAE